MEEYCPPKYQLCQQHDPPTYSSVRFDTLIGPCLLFAVLESTKENCMIMTYKNVIKGFKYLVVLRSQTQIMHMYSFVCHVHLELYNSTQSIPS
jgi:hypothetical protein